MNNKPQYYKQSDPRWAKIPYTIDGDAHETIGASGCGPTCTAMIIASVIDPQITPVEMCKLAIELKDRTANNGTEWEFFEKVAAQYNIPFKQTGSIKEVIDALINGAYAVCSMKPGKFTKGGHYILAWDFYAKNLLVHDPASTAKERTWGDIPTFERECKQYFIYFVNQRKMPILKKGMNGEAVKILQEQLNKFKYNLIVDGVFGNKTSEAVRAFQAQKGLKIEEIVGPMTWNALFKG